MPHRTMPSAMIAATALAGLAGLWALAALEARWPPLAWWAFVVLSLTVGMGHGALDAVLLLWQFKPVGKAVAISAVYLLAVVLAAMALSLSVGAALLILVGMSLWHFGEMYRSHVLRRVAVGGASVMWPVLVAADAMQALLEPVLAGSLPWVWAAWRGMAWCWLAVALVTLLLAVGQRWRKPALNLFTDAEDALRPMAIEIAAVLVLYLAVSPLLAFALYFGLYHCMAHVARVQRALASRSGVPRTQSALVLVASVGVTALLMVALWRWLPAAQFQGYANGAQVLQWLVVALAAVTMPHLVLVSYSARWLGR
jgi:Brp/Blh family beta-carotene 15,15'-monooxygenase